LFEHDIVASASCVPVIDVEFAEKNADNSPSGISVVDVDFVRSVTKSFVSQDGHGSSVRLPAINIDLSE
jgi:hypothetical protein